ncbi:ankyrin repeat domain-containing protein 39-like [Daphnia pulicaria]|uniref:ankyrin repeat domain-containing protein 39-like n=1 Tax=Daphnia pulicaria TaxID=35523 RepID=UPI001EE9F7BF|nr:ankyrin repeat domain-containing protein 39-like [Daphnia pulicaria]
MEQCTHHNCQHTASASQTLEEMDFERGPWSAALDGDLNRLSKLLQKMNADAVDTSGYSSLHYASRAGHLEVSSPLHRACQQGHLLVVKFLLQNGADAGLQDSDGCTPLHRAALANRTDIYVAVYQKTAVQVPL